MIPSAGAPAEAQRDAERVAVEVRGLLAPLHEALGHLRDEIERTYRAVHAAGRSMQEEDLVDLPAFFAVHALLKDLVVGAGYAAAPGAVGGQERYLLWWQRRGDTLARLRLNLEPTSVDVYDFLEMDWFRGARATRRPYMYGPYLDYSGSGLYVFTGVVPVWGEDFIGVAGADLPVRETERHLTRLLRSLDHDAIVVTGERRVIASNTHRWVVGAKTRSLPEVTDHGAFLAVVPVGIDTDWQVAVAAPE
jgi:hypothetical protein